MDNIGRHVREPEFSQTETLTGKFKEVIKAIWRVIVVIIALGCAAVTFVSALCVIVSVIGLISPTALYALAEPGQLELPSHLTAWLCFMLSCFTLTGVSCGWFAYQILIPSEDDKRMAVWGKVVLILLIVGSIAGCALSINQISI